MQIRLVGAKLFHADTDVTKPLVIFRV